MKNFLKSKAFIISAVAVVVIGGGTAVAQFSDFPRFAHHHAVDRLVDRMGHKLDLSDAQRREVKAALDDTVRRFRGSRDGRIDDAAALLNQPQLTVDDVRGAMQARDANGVRVDREALIAETMVRIHAVLTPAQRSELAEALE